MLFWNGKGFTEIKNNDLKLNKKNCQKLILYMSMKICVNI